MVSSFHQVKNLVPTLSAEERRKLKTLLGAFSGEHTLATRGKPEKRIDNATGDWLLAGIVWELSRRGLGRNRIDADLVRRISPSFQTESIAVRTRLTSQLNKPRQEELVALGRVVARAVANHRSPVTPLTLKFMLNNTRNSLEAIDASFPGYLGAGMVRYLIK